jgi:hypothetical protein
MNVQTPDRLETKPPETLSRRMIAGMALGSARRFVSLERHRSLRRPPERLGQSFRVDDGRSYRIFRETVSDAAPATAPVVLVVGFQLRAIRAFALPHWIFQRCCLLTTPFWSGLPGFSVKLWMVDPETKRYLGIYDWRGVDTAQRYVSALVRVLGPLSTDDSVWFQLIPNQPLDPYLAAQASGLSSTTPPCPAAPDPIRP